MGAPERVGSRFTIEAEAGRGGMGTVYRARDAVLGGLVALKVVSADDDVDLARFEREALVVARLAHPHVVRYVDHGRTEDGLLYLAMEWLEGETLAERARRAPLSPREAARVIQAAAEGLAAAHREGVVHRDVKPANLFLPGGELDRLKVIDFGIARQLHRHDLTLTTTGMVVGTPYYMAPEQARADSGVDARADVYSLGAVLYELLTGRPPFANETLMALLAAILLEEPVDVRERAPDVPDALAELTMRLIEKAPDARPSDGAALASLLDRLDVSRAASPRSVAPPALTEREQRVLCLVLGAGRFSVAPNAATLASGASDTVGRMRAAVEAHGGRLEVLADGSLVARIEASATPTERAVRAARCALAMRAVDPAVPLALVAGRGMFRGPLPVGEVIERGSRMLAGAIPLGAATLPSGSIDEDAPATLAIRVDDEMAGLIEGRYELVRDAQGRALGSERRDATTARTLLGRRTPCVGRRRELAALDALFAECVEEPIARVAFVTAPAGGGKSRLIAELIDRWRARDAASLSKNEREGDLPPVGGGSGALDAGPTPALPREEAVEKGPLRKAGRQEFSPVFLPSSAVKPPFATASERGRELPAQESRQPPSRGGSSPSEQPSIWIARGDPVGAGSPFALIAQLVRAASGIADGEPLEARRAKILARIGGAIGGERGRVAAARLGAAARTPFEDSTSLPPDDPKLRGDAMRDAFVDWLDATTRAQPLVIVLDDLQWGDRPSLAFVASALRELHDRPLLVLAAGRPEASEPFTAAFDERDAQLVRLARLTPRAAEELARHVLGERAEDDLIARLIERADGNPFFLEELVRAIDEGRDEAGLPATVLGMVEARLAVLDAETRRVLRAASVFGRRFWRDGVGALLGGAVDLDAHLAVLAQRELVDRVSEPRLTGQVELAFRNELTREAALATLTDEDRRLGHRLAGAWLERAGERDALVLAEHFTRGEDAARAALWLGRAAEQALEGDDLAVAIDRAERALASAASRGPILVTLADAHRWRGEYARAFARASEAAEALEPGTRAWFRALGVLFASAGRVNRSGDADPWRERAASLEAYPDARGAQVVALCRAAALSLGSGDRARFDLTMDRAEHLAKGAPDDALARAWILTMRASWAAREGDSGAFVDDTEAAIAAYEAAGDARDACNQKVRLGNGYIGLGDVERAEVVLREALTAARRMSLPLIEGYALQNLGHALLRKGAMEEAMRAEEQAIAIARRLDDAVLEAGCLLYLAEAHERAGRASDAVSDASRAVELLQAVPPFQTVARAVLARAVLAEGDRERALALAQEAAGALTAHALEEGEALVHLVEAEALLANERATEARERAHHAAARLAERAAKIADLGWRDAFLHRVPAHARLLEIAAR